MEINNEPTQSATKPEFVWLPKECNFTMQQWLYRRTLHTKRYKKRYLILHNERLYTFNKLPSFDKFDSQNLNNVLKQASNNWILTGSIVSADPDVNGGLFRWKIQFKNYKKPVSSTDNFNKFLLDKPELEVTNSDNIDCIFDDVTSSVLENKSTNLETHDCLWFATTSHKIASDWVIALLHTSRYGSLYNLIYKNPSRRRYQQFTLPWYLRALDYVPNLAKDENSKQPLTSFTYIKIDILRLFEFPMLPNAKIYCAVEFNSSFYIIQLYRYELDNSTSTPVAILHDEDIPTTLNYYVNQNKDYQSSNSPSDETNQSVYDQSKSVTPDDEWLYGNYTKMGSNRSIDQNSSSNLPEKSRAASSAAASLAALPEDEHQNVLARLKNLNSSKSIEKKQVVEKRTIVYEDASVYIPVYKNTTQEVVWLHFFGDFDVYMGTASIRDVDFGSRDPAPVKTCMIKLVDNINPLNYKRVDVSTYKGESTVVSKSTAKSLSNDRGFVELSVIIPKHLGNFLDPVIISYGSPKEYLSSATKSSITVGIQMLIANIKRVRQSFTVLKDIIHSLKSVLEFRNMFSSFIAMSYFILVFGIFPNRILIIFLLPLLGYIVCTHPSFVDLTFLFLLKFPILIAILPKSFTYRFLLMPKTSCILCSKKPSFLKANAITVDPEMITKVEISSRTFHYSSNKKNLSTKSLLSRLRNDDLSGQESPPVISNPFSAANAIQINPATNEQIVADNQNSLDLGNKLHQNPGGFFDFEKRISVHLNSLPMITSKHLLNDSIDIKTFRGAKIETCKHRGIILSYLSIMFINEMGVELFDSVKGSGLSIIKGYHDIYYNTPPYRHVPFWANVKFTLYFFMYMLFLTFFGGISSLQLLHLLHKNKLMCRLTLESTGVVDTNLKSPTSPPKPKTMSLYENERKILFGKFSKVNLRFYERTYFSTEDGQFVSVDLSKHLIKLVINENTDKEGWMYAKNWNGPFSKEPSSMTFVRRRKWLLTPKENKTSEYILKRKLTSNITSDYFSNTNHTSNFNRDKRNIDHDCLSISSTDSYRSPNASNINLDKLVDSSNTNSAKNKLGFRNRGNNKKMKELHYKDTKTNDSEVTNLSNLNKMNHISNSKRVPDDKIDQISNTDENVTKLYSRKGKIKGLVEKFRDMRERRRSQKLDSSNMHMYLSSLVTNKKNPVVSDTQSRLRILSGLKFSKRQHEQREGGSSSNAFSTTNNGVNNLAFHNDDYDNLSISSGSKYHRSDFDSFYGANKTDDEPIDLMTSLMNLNKNKSSSDFSESKCDETYSRSRTTGINNTLNNTNGLDLGIPLRKRLYSVKKLRKSIEKEKDCMTEVYEEEKDNEDNEEKRDKEGLEKGYKYGKDKDQQEQDKENRTSNIKELQLRKTATNSKLSTTKIARLMNYLSSLHKTEDELLTDRSGYSTITQTTTRSNQSYKNKSRTWKFFETLFALVFALPVCLVLDLGKLCIEFFGILIRTILGIPEPENETQPTITKHRVIKHRAMCELVVSDDNKLYFKLTKPSRCFMLGDRINVYRRICRAENLSFVHNMNRLMFDSKRNYDSDSDTSSEAGSEPSVISLRDNNMERSFSNQYVEDSDVIVESDLDNTRTNEIETEDELDELRTLSMNPFDLDDSDEDIINMMKKSFDSNDVEMQPKKGKKKKGKFANYISTIYLKRMAKKGKYIDEQHLSDYEQESDEGKTNDSKMGLIATLKKVKDQIIMANYKINLYNMRFEKFLNMFSWKNYSVTTIVLFLLLLIIFLNLLFSFEIIILVYILNQFKSGYRRGTWERIILNTTKRHISKAIVELEIFRPFWDLSTHQIRILAERIKSFSSIELEINTIREAKDEWHLAYIVSDRLVATKFARNWKRYRWINNLFRQAPCKQY